MPEFSALEPVAIAVDALVIATGTVGAAAGAGLGALLGLGVVAMTMLSDALFSGWGWPST